MRLDKYVSTRAWGDPLTNSGAHTSFVSGHLGPSVGDYYDLYFVQGVVYVCRGGCILMFVGDGAAYAKGPEAAKTCADLAKRFPRPKQDAPQNPHP
jgi:hypothetical protein